MKPRMTDVVLPPTFEQTASFTPGPWKWHPKSVDQEHNGSIYSEQRIGHAYAIAMQPRYVTDEQWAADARLIAAAPELLAALENLDFHAASFATNSAGPLQPELLRMSLERARAAIAKAKAGA